MGFEGLLQVGDGATAAGARAARNWSLIPSFNFSAQRWRKRSAAGALAPSVVLESLGIRTFIGGMIGSVPFQGWSRVTADAPAHA